MRGTVLGYDADKRTGAISGADGERYHFAPDDVVGGRDAVRPGKEVDFVPGENGVARSVFGMPTEGALAEPAALADDKNRFIAAILAFLFGPLGLHKFYLGRNGAGVTMLLCGTIGWVLIIPGLVVCVIAFVEFIIYLVKGDAAFRRDYVEGTRAWF